MLEIISLAVTLLTGRHVPRHKRLTRADVARTVGILPLLGGLLAVIPIASFLISQRMWSGRPMIGAAIYVVTELIVNQCRGTSALAKTADAVSAYLAGGGKSAVSTIMRDEHRGTIGVISVVVAVMLKFAFVATIPSAIAWQTLLISSVVGRWGTSFAFSAFHDSISHPLIDGDDLTGLSDAGPLQLLPATATVFVVAALLPVRGIVGCVAACAVCVLIANGAHRRLGGTPFVVAFGLGELAQIAALAALTVG